MSDYDHLMSELIRVKKLLESYVDEYQPMNGEPALDSLMTCMVKVSKFIEDERI